MRYVLHIWSVFVCVALGIQYAMRMRLIVICGLHRCTKFFHIISYMARFSNIYTLKTKCVLLFPLQHLSETFLILRRTEWDMIKKCLLVFMLIPIYSCLILMKPEFSRQFFRKILNTKTHENMSSCSMWRDGRMDRHDEANSRFSPFYERTSIWKILS
jgi:hypothetical protein